MIDVWLIFNLFKPFLDLLVHTYADYLRVEEDDDDKDDEDDKENCGIKLWNWIFMRNTSKIEPKKEAPKEQAPLDLPDAEALPTYAELTQVQEGKQNVALTKYYSKMKANEEEIETLHTFSIWIYPIFCVIFISIYWLVGLLHSYDKI